MIPKIVHQIWVGPGRPPMHHEILLRRGGMYVDCDFQ